MFFFCFRVKWFQHALAGRSTPPCRGAILGSTPPCCGAILGSAATLRCPLHVLTVSELGRLSSALFSCTSGAHFFSSWSSPKLRAHEFRPVHPGIYGSCSPRPCSHAQSKVVHPPFCRSSASMSAISKLESSDARLAQRHPPRVPQLHETSSIHVKSRTGETRGSVVLYWGKTMYI